MIFNRLYILSYFIMIFCSVFCVRRWLGKLNTVYSVIYSVICCRQAAVYVYKTEYIIVYITVYSICKILNNMLPVSLGNKIEMVGNVDQRRTRHAGNIMMEFRKGRNAQKSVFHEGVKMYNCLSLRIKKCNRLKVFKRELKEHILYTIRYF